MKILLVTPCYLEKGKAGRGAIIYLDRFAKSLMQMGHSPIVVTGGNVEAHEKFGGIDTYRVDTFGFRTGNEWVDVLIDCLLGNYILQKKVKEICKNQKIDLIQYLGNNGSGMFHNLKIPAVIRLSCYYKVSFVTNSHFPKWQLLIHSLIEREAIKKMDGVYCPSKKLAKDVMKDIKKKVYVIESPFFNEINKLDESVYESRLKDKKFILFFGFISPEKGTLLIADMAEKILSKYKDYYIVLIGKDSSYQGHSTLEEIKKRTKVVSNQMIYMNALQHSQLYPIIQKAEFVLLPSYMENLANACFEAMYFKKIVIGTNGASFEQLITDGENGYLFEQGNSEDLLRCVIRVLELSDDKKKEMEEKAKKRIDGMRPEVTVKRALRFYKYVIENYKK